MQYGHRKPRQLINTAIFALACVSSSVAFAQENRSITENITRNVTENVTSNVTTTATGTTNNTVNETRNIKVNLTGSNNITDTSNITTTFSLNGDKLANVINGNSQNLSGANVVSSGIVQNIVGTNLNLNSTAIGNIAGGKATAVTFNSQDVQGGRIDSRVDILGASTQFQTMTVNANAIANLFTADASAATYLGNNMQTVNGTTVSGHFNWNQDPTPNATISVTAIGNALLINTPTVK